jgi:hypothetical protein
MNKQNRRTFLYLERTRLQDFFPVRGHNATWEPGKYGTGGMPNGMPSETGLVKIGQVVQKHVLRDTVW